MKVLLHNLLRFIKYTQYRLQIIINVIYILTELNTYVH
jgi:hypothetical protein